MNSVREAFALTFLERYLGLLVNLGTLAVVSRLLTPAEVGIAAIGWGVLSIAYALRDLGAMDYIVQRKDLTRTEIRTAATVCAIASVCLVGLVVAGAPSIASLFGEPGIAAFLSVMAFAIITDAVANPLVGLMRRDLQFRQVAMVNITLNVVSSVATIAFALAGFSYMSTAWAGVLGNAAAAALALVLRPALWAFKPSLANWRDVLGAGLFFSAMAVLTRAYEALPYLALGRTHHPADCGHFNRALQTCQLPEKVLLAGISSVAFPVLAAEVREGRQLRQSYLAAVELITALSWPAYAMLALLAPRVVEILFGAQWEAAAPLVQIMAVASFCGAASTLNYPMLYAIGHPRIAFATTIATLPVSAVVIFIAAKSGAQALAWCMLVTVAINNAVVLHVINRHIELSWRDFFFNLRKSMIVFLAAMAGPAVLVVLSAPTPRLALWTELLAVALAAAGWLGAIFATSHKLLDELSHIARLVATAFSRGGSKQPPSAATGVKPTAH